MRVKVKLESIFKIPDWAAVTKDKEGLPIIVLNGTSFAPAMEMMHYDKGIMTLDIEKSEVIMEGLEYESCDIFILHPSLPTTQRIDQCVSACKGMEDPGDFITDVLEIANIALREGSIFAVCAEDMDLKDDYMIKLRDKIQELIGV